MWGGVIHSYEAEPMYIFQISYKFPSENPAAFFLFNTFICIVSKTGTINRP